MRYEIIDGIVFIYDADSKIPFIRQPNWPSGDAWAKSEAEAWAKQVILSLTDPTADLAGSSPDKPIEPRPVLEEQTLTIEP